MHHTFVVNHNDVTFLVEASNTFGASKLKVAVPDEPSVARVSLISGITFSGRPLTNSIEAPAMERVDADREAGLEGANAEARAGTEAARMVVNFMLENFKTRMFVAVDRVDADREAGL